MASRGRPGAAGAAARGTCAPAGRYDRRMSTLMHTHWVPLGPEGFDGFLVLPPAGTGPGLLLWQEIFGVNGHIRRVAEQYALAGFTVLAPDVFWRSERRVELGYGSDDMQRGRALKDAIAPDALRADIQAAAAALRARPETAGGKIGALGYCLGGRLAYLSAAHADVDAAVAYYGGGIHDQLAAAPGIRGALQFHYAEHDGHIPLDAVARVREATARPGNQLHVYPDTQHGFNCWSRDSYQPAASALALGRSVAFLAERLF